MNGRPPQLNKDAARPAALPLSVVIPVYNEAENITPTLRELVRYLPSDYEIICVYDFDQDTTVPVLRHWQGELPGLRLLKNQIARGASGAIRTGLRAARGERIVVVMADLCDDVSQIPVLMQQVPDHADIACPSRYCPGGEQHLKNRLKVWLPKAANFLLRHLVGISSQDCTNSYKMYSRSWLEQLRLTSTISFSVTLEIIAKTHCLKGRIVEIPTVWKGRQFGQSTFKIGRAVPAYMKWFLLAALRNRLLPVPPALLRRWLLATHDASGDPVEAA